MINIIAGTNYKFKSTKFFVSLIAYPVGSQPFTCLKGSLVPKLKNTDRNQKVFFETK